MAEAALVFAVVGSLVVLGLMATLLPVESLLLSGACCILLGIVLGVPAGMFYHLKLYRWLAANGGVPRGFIWHPTRYHARLSPDAWKRVMPWFAAGAAGFVLIMLGCVIVALSVWRFGYFKSG
jgi:hypothetical protein